MIYVINKSLLNLGSLLTQITVFIGLCGFAASAIAENYNLKEKLLASKSCASELSAMKSSHAVVNAAIGPLAIKRLDVAAQAHGRQILLWYADLLEMFIADSNGMHPLRLSFLQSSSSYLRCKYAMLNSLPEWNSSRGQSKIPSVWAIPGDLLITENGCGVFIRGEIIGVPGHGVSSDRMAWTWTGPCRDGMANGTGEAKVILRSGEVRDGLLGTGFAKTSFRKGQMDGLYQATDASGESQEWRNHFDRYTNGRIVQRLQRQNNGGLLEIKYQKHKGYWGWTKVKDNRQPIQLNKKLS